MRPRRLLPPLTSNTITASYVILGVFWILLSDQLVEMIANSQTTLTLLHTAKGWLFIAGSGLLLLGLTRTHEHRLTQTQTQLETATQQLQVLHRIFRHNIRNDLNVIQGNLRAIADDTSQPQHEARLAAANRSVDQLLGMSEKLTVIDTMYPAETTSSPINLRAVLEPEITRIQTEHPEITIQTAVPEDLWISGDLELAHAIRECFNNAIQHYDDDLNSLTLDITATKTESDVILRIQDNGPGLPPTDLQAIQAGNETNLTHLTGVGLWLVSWVCQTHNGALELETDGDSGTVVELHFEPASPLQKVRQAPETTTRGHAATA